ncbi:MAG: Nramp family divalent metal transporter [Solirubrobacteraceae bacterium]
MSALPEPILETAGVDGHGPALAGQTSAHIEPGAPFPAEGTPLERMMARGRLRATLTMLGPAFVAAVAYVDPGNFATNVSAGAQFGYALLWVVMVANLMAMLIQYLSAKLGVVTGHSLPELCRERFPRWSTWALWVQAEVMAMATDVAEFLGAAIGLNLIFGVPLFASGLITGVIAFAILELQRRGFRPFELAIAALLGIVFAGFLYETLKIGPSAQGALRGLVPGGLGNLQAVYLAVGIVGATVMPHVIYLHSSLTTGRMPVRDDEERRRVLRFERSDVLIALGLAGLINLAMLAAAAKLFHVGGLTGVSTIQGAHAQLGHLVGGGAALAFAVALLASGASSSSVGTYAGQVVMAGFIGLQISVVLRRAVTMTPALIILALGANPNDALVLSQVVLSFGIPFALVPLVILTSRRDVMGAQVNGRLISVLAYVIAGAITAMNIFLIFTQFVG